MTTHEDWNRAIIEEFRAADGRVGGQFEGAPMLLLTTTGARSGQQRTTPLMYLPDDERLIVFASYAGAPKHPAWYHNLVANPRVTVEVGTETAAMTATIVAGAERNELYARQVSHYPGFGEYQEKTDRLIPVVALTRP
ncbi:MAG: nitroreductase family deazaflavin-dependent oxidoreductase [Actinobacteria bacterium]|nr:nitroreductase family deazaflavin-dependent oxidoreductase [Actinomycetota bacterium]